MRLVSKQSIDVGGGYRLLILADEAKYWVRLGEAFTGRYLRFWSRDAHTTTRTDFEAVTDRVVHGLQTASPRELQTESAMNIFVAGWDFWPAIPSPIADDLASETLTQQIVEWSA